MADDKTPITLTSLMQASEDQRQYFRDRVAGKASAPVNDDDPNAEGGGDDIGELFADMSDTERELLIERAEQGNEVALQIIQEAAEAARQRKTPTGRPWDDRQERPSRQPLGTRQRTNTEGHARRSPPSDRLLATEASMARTLKNSKLNPVSNPDYVDNALDTGDMSGAAEVRSASIAKAFEGASTEPDWDRRAAAKKALAKAQKG